MDPDLERLFQENDFIEKEVILSRNKKKKLGVLFLPLLLLVVVLAIILEILLFPQFFLILISGILLLVGILGNIAYFTLNWNMPVKMYLDGKGVRIEFVFSFQDVNFPWNYIKDVKIYDHIKLESGKKIKLQRIAKENWDEFMDSMKKSDTDLEATIRLDNIIQKTKQAPTEEYTIKGMSSGFLISYIILLILSIILVLLAPIMIVISSLDGDLMMVNRMLIFLAISIAAIPLSIKMISLILKKQSIQIGTEGISVYTKDKLRCHFSWNEIRECYTTTKLNGNIEAIGVSSKDGTRFWVGHHELRRKELKEGFSLIKKYCVFYDIRIVNNLGW